ncbi:RagB/SusD family nutrient uptake outer membrane protein [Bacteroides sp. 519]|uniref:RagB/SusD family nutrient uptake outer membrane protein n=1 Tax=Bacteroides sp. 519 TaxID=2302937 RepID=UPI0013D70D06|nr:RagB/SusD family nutrient uptake outer membrane protein [Bacteroides sp. 519]NDV57364.1 RagB/SusD family nutrient uptake outer membrane protein [Bacteroides sp. 519]
MKNLTKWFVAAFVGATIFSSCVDQIKFGDSFLEKAPDTGDMNQDTIFNKADYARAFLWNAYSKLYYGLATNWNAVDGKMNTGMFETLSDCWHSHNSWDGINRKYYSGGYKASDEDAGDDTKFNYLKENCWEAIRASWMFIENVDRVPDMNDAEKTRLKAEAKTIIASRYFDLFRHFGGLPLLEQTYDVQPSYELPRATAEETANYIVRLLDEAANVLPWDLGEDDANWQGRFTKAAAMGLKCKVLLFAASPLFNDNQAYSTENPQTAVENHQVWYGAYKAEWWERCWQACSDFFEELDKNGFYSLIQPNSDTPSDYRAAFNHAYFLRTNNTELLISTRIIGKYNWEWWYYWGEWVTFGGYTPTLEYMQMFPMSDGKPFSDEYLKEGAHPFFNQNDNNQPVRDPRLYETMLVNGASYSDHTAELWIGGRENIDETRLETGQTATGFRNYKFFKEGKGSLAGNYLEWPYLRLAEVYLIYAEACLQAKNDFAGALENVNIVRSRVGLGKLETCNPDKNLTSNKDALLEEILRERACELGLEDVRFFDMIRYKRDDLFKKPLHGLRIYRNDGGGDKPWSGTDGNASAFPNKPASFRYEVFTLGNSSRSWWSNFSSKWYLSAFPPSEVNKGYGLTQNPGWN